METPIVITIDARGSDTAAAENIRKSMHQLKQTVEAVVASNLPRLRSRDICPACGSLLHH